MKHDETPCDSADPLDRAAAYAAIELQALIENHYSATNVIKEPAPSATCAWCLNDNPVDTDVFCCPECRIEWRTDAESDQHRHAKTHGTGR